MLNFKNGDAGENLPKRTVSSLELNVTAHFNATECAAATGLVIDEAELDLVRSYMTSEQFCALLNLCLEQIFQYMENLEKPPVSLDRLTALAHAMVGSAGAVGAGTVAAMARRLEAASSANEASAVDELTGQLIVAWAEVVRELKLRHELESKH